MPASRLFALAFSFSLFASTTASAQAQLGGRVVDPQGRPVAGATVVAIGSTSAPVEDQTDDQGRFLLIGLASANVDPDGICITNGGQEALTLALKSVAQPGDVIAVESPSYYGLLELIGAQ